MSFERPADAVRLLWRNVTEVNWVRRGCAVIATRPFGEQKRLGRCCTRGELTATRTAIARAPTLLHRLAKDLLWGSGLAGGAVGCVGVWEPREKAHVLEADVDDVSIAAQTTTQAEDISQKRQTEVF